MGKRNVTGNAPLNRREMVAAALLRLAPRLPDFEAGVTLDRALASPGLRGAAPETAAWLSLVAYARHVFTEYDALLDDGYDRESARHFVRDDLNAALGAWGVRRQISDADTDAPNGADDPF